MPPKDSIALALAPTKSFFRLSAPFMLVVLEAVAQVDHATSRSLSTLVLDVSTLLANRPCASDNMLVDPTKSGTVQFRPTDRPTIRFDSSNNSLTLHPAVPRSGRPTPLPPILFISTPFSALSFRNYPRSLSSPLLPIGPLSPSGNARSFLVLHVVLFVLPSPRGSTNRSWAGVAVVQVSVFITVHDTHSAPNYYIR